MATTATQRIPGMTSDDTKAVIETLSERLAALIDLALTLKHVHWNVVGPLHRRPRDTDPQVDAVRKMVDETAERIATLGGTLRDPGAVVTSAHGTTICSARLRCYYPPLRPGSRRIEDHRKAQEQFSEQDPVSEDLIIGQLRELELFQWFVRAHLENSGES